MSAVGGSSVSSAYCSWARCRLASSSTATPTTSVSDEIAIGTQRRYAYRTLDVAFSTQSAIWKARRSQHGATRADQPEPRLEGREAMNLGMPLGGRRRYATTLGATECV